MKTFDNKSRKNSAQIDSNLSRRVVLKGALAAAAMGTSHLSLPSKASASDGSLRILCWPGYDERQVIEEFEDIHKVKVQFKTYVSGEQMLSFLLQAPPGTFDAVITDAEYIDKLRSLEIIEPYDTSNMPAFADYQQHFHKSNNLDAGEGKKWAIPTRYGFYGITSDEEYLSSDEAKDYSSLLLPKLEGKVGLYDWYLPNMGMASLVVNPEASSPYDLDDGQLEKVREWMKGLRSQIALFGTMNQPIIQALISGEIHASYNNNIYIDLKLAGYDRYHFSIPKQGGIRWEESAALCTNSPNKELALEWIKYMSQAEVQSRLVYTDAIKAHGPNTKIVDYFDDAQRELLFYVPDSEQPDKMLVESMLERTTIRGTPVQQSENQWINIYNEFKSAA